MITLEHGPFKLSLTPEFGGSVSGFIAFGHNVLRPTTFMRTTSWDARDSAGFPMLPFVGRISNGRFEVNGKDVTLPANIPPEPHSIHGFGWQRPWIVADLTDNSVLLRHDYAEGHWPWPYQAEQKFELNDNGLRLTLSIRNESETPMPAGIGWHPYFPKDSATLQAPVTRSWTGQNTAPEKIGLTNETDLRQARQVKGLDLDTAFDCENTNIILKTSNHSIKLESDPVFSKLTVYTPQGEDYFCVEPVTHAPDAINMSLPAADTGLIWLDPGKTLSGKIWINVKPR
ncbi:MAG: aldose 1-epimerase [Pseudomonadota bacterium]